MTALLELCKKLIDQPSVSPQDAQCQTIMMDFLKQLGFKITELNDGPVKNFWAQLGTHGPLLAFAGHTDVVPAGDQSKWITPAFCATVKDDKLFGRGAADMKGALACMLIATERFLKQSPAPNGSIGFLITSGEEGDDFLHGTPRIMAYLNENNIHIDACIVGEPSCNTQIGDTIRIGRRGSLSAEVTIHGKQGHVAYPHLALNPIHKASQFLHEFTHIQWDKGNTYFPPTSMQITSLHTSENSGNVIPGFLTLKFNFRYSTELTHEDIQQRVENLLKTHDLSYDIKWRHNGNPFLTDANTKLVRTLQHVIREKTQLSPTLSTAGGTSDARFIAPYGIPVIEFGLINETIHQVNEHVSLQSLETLTDIYLNCLIEY